MEFSLNHAFNASAEIADAGRYPGLRMFTAAHAVANSAQTDVHDKTGGTGIYADSPWAVSSPQAFAPVGQRDFSWFSAVCYLFGRDVYRELNGEVPIGLVASDWGGQAIQVFSSPDALKDTTCGGTVPQQRQNDFSRSDAVAEAAVAPAAHHTADGNFGDSGDGVTNSQLWFAMLAPFVHMRFAGSVWYQ